MKRCAEKEIICTAVSKNENQKTTLIETRINCVTSEYLCNESGEQTDLFVLVYCNRCTAETSFAGNSVCVGMPER